MSTALQMENPERSIPFSQSLKTSQWQSLRGPLQSIQTSRLQHLCKGTEAPLKGIRGVKWTSGSLTHPPREGVLARTWRLVSFPEYPGASGPMPPANLGQRDAGAVHHPLLITTHCSGFQAGSKPRGPGCSEIRFWGDTGSRGLSITEVTSSSRT